MPPLTEAVAGVVRLRGGQLTKLGAALLRALPASSGDTAECVMEDVICEETSVDTPLLASSGDVAGCAVEMAIGQAASGQARSGQTPIRRHRGWKGQRRGRKDGGAETCSIVCVRTRALLSTWINRCAMCRPLRRKAAGGPSGMVLRDGQNLMGGL